MTTLITAAKETKGDPEEFQRQISSHSETEPIRRVSSSTRKKKGKKTREVECIILLRVVAA